LRTDPEEAMARAVWNGKVLAECERTETIAGSPSSTTSHCPVKGQARYMSLFVNGEENLDAAWYYPDPQPVARKIKGHIAFWRGVEVAE
jgi:uncharacterized protein (DUF427 family)